MYPNQTFGAGQRLIVLHIGNINITEYDYFEVVIEEFARMKSQKKCSKVRCMYSLLK